MEFSGQYLTYDEYIQLGGTLSKMPFDILEFNARQQVDKYTLGRLKDLQNQNQEVKMCIYKLIDVINNYTSNETIKSGVSSETIDGYSISYNTPSREINDAKNSEIKDIIKTYLIDCKLENGVPYMYIGADDNK